MENCRGKSILKSVNSEDPCNNQPISLLPILSKVSERLAYGQFVDYSTANKILAKTQGGNRKLYSTETAILCVTDDLLQAIDAKKISALALYSTCQRPLTALDIIFYCRNYKLLASPLHAVTGSIATLLAAVKEYASMMLSLMHFPGNMEYLRDQ